MNWNGRQLESGDGSQDVIFSFTYNDNGIRTSKTVDGVKTTYYLDGSRIIGEETAGNVTMYLYDSQGLPMGMMYHSSSYGMGAFDVYWFERNMQGDIIAVYDKSGTKLVSYVYDAYGNFYRTLHGISLSHTAANNPFTYRGYYYDYNLQLYYVGTRYYDSDIGRWLSPDKYVSTGQGLTGYNMFAYCGNNPIMYVDYTGEFPWAIVIILSIGLIGGAVVGASLDTKIIDNNIEQKDLTGTEKDTDSSDDSSELTVGDRVTNAVICAGFGVALMGAGIATGGVFFGATGIGTGIFGVSALQMFGIGALAYNSVAIGLLPIFGIAMEPIEYETPTTQPGVVF